jgi:hypothetical protein
MAETMAVIIKGKNYLGEGLLLRLRLGWRAAG